MKPGTPPLKSTRLMDQMCERIRYLHYSLSTEKTYHYWVRFFTRWHGRNVQMQHPRNIGAPCVQAFLNVLAMQRSCCNTSGRYCIRQAFANVRF